MDFIKALLDFKFETFLTRKIAGVIYIVLVAAILLGTALLIVFGFVISSQNYDQLGYALALLIGAPVVALLSIIMLRLAFEASVALVAVAENTGRK